jgi:choline dehydrogenase-like flavoprotein
VADALKSGNCKLITNAVVSHVDMDDAENKARGVTYVDRVTRQTYQVRGRAVILCAQALESTRILLNSKTREYPGGLANSSGALGHHLMDHAVGAGAAGEMPDLITSHSASQPQRNNGLYVIRFRNLQAGPRHARFIRGYGYQGGAGMNFAFNAEGFGASYKNAVRRGAYGISLDAFGESLGRWENCCEIDANLKDAWGIPALRISMTHGANEIAMMEDAAASAAEMLEAGGAKNIRMNTEVQMPGMAIHEVGTARMGNDPKKSVLNAWNQTHDVKNLFVTDGSCFVSSACQNPTLTMMAITVRACEGLVERLKRG